MMQMAVQIVSIDTMRMYKLTNGTNQRQENPPLRDVSPDTMTRIAHFVDMGIWEATRESVGNPAKLWLLLN